MPSRQAGTRHVSQHTKQQTFIQCWANIADARVKTTLGQRLVFAWSQDSLAFMHWTCTHSSAVQISNTSKLTNWNNCHDFHFMPCLSNRNIGIVIFVSTHAHNCNNVVKQCTLGKINVLIYLILYLLPQFLYLLTYLVTYLLAWLVGCLLVCLLACLSTY